MAWDEDMTSQYGRPGLLLVACFLAFAGGASAQPAPQAADPVGAIVEGRPILEVRTRNETVDQAGFAEDAEAVTVRTRLGWQTAIWRGWRGLAEVETVSRLGGYRYNDTVRPNPAYSVVADPAVTELNRLQLSWTAGAAFTATAGRQRINLDDQRFVGAVGWRQDEQTFDAVQATGQAGPAIYTFAYLWRVNRVNGQAQDWGTDAWLANVAIPFHPALRPQAFLYALAFETAPAQSSLTWGLRLTGQSRRGPVALTYAGVFARQTDYRNSPAPFQLSFWQLEGQATWGPLSLRADYEVLEGDGQRGFSTPLGTLHAFQGWADVFLTTPADGLRDANVSVTFRPRWRVGSLRDFEFTVRGHDFSAERTDRDLGSEIDALAQVRFTPSLTGLVKYADFSGVPGFASRRKLWIALEYRF